VAPSQTLTDDQCFSVLEFLDEKQNDGCTVSLSALKAFLEQRHQLVIPTRQLRDRLHGMGLQYGVALSARHVNTQSERWQQWRASYAVRWAQALELERKGEAVIVYMDESYVHAHHRRRYTWYAPESDLGRSVRCVGGKGELLIMVHAITSSGLLAATDEKGRYFEPAFDATGKQRSAELLYSAKSPPNDDYHNHFDAVMFERWIKNRLLPAFRAVFCTAGHYPRLILVCDNASYHKAHSEDWVAVSGANKAKLSALLSKHNILSFSVERGASKVTFDASNYETRAPAGPSLVELRQRVEQLLRDKPLINRTLAQRALDKEVRVYYRYVVPHM
jgi:hypothetical protein